MAKDNLKACLPVTLAYEGGWADHPKDPGGPTMKGITLATYQRYFPGATRTQLRNISTAHVEMIYRDGYWEPVAGDTLPYGVDLATFDYGVNSGPSRAVKALQFTVGATADGKAGPETIKTVAASPAKAVIQRLCARRLSFLQGLKTWATFKGGWSKRVANVEAKAVAMWLKASSATTDDIRDELNEEADKAEGTAKTQEKGAAGAGAGGAATGGGVTVATGEPHWWIFGVIAIAVVVAVAVFIIKARQNRDRAQAYRDAAALGG